MKEEENIISIKENDEVKINTIAEISINNSTHSSDDSTES
jgi:hypothetical protein